MAGIDQRHHFLLIRLKVFIGEQSRGVASKLARLGTVSSSTSV
jgi:hypothetical protein